MAALTIAALVLQFGFAFQVHFMVPLLLQLAVRAWTLVCWKLDR